MTQQILVIEDEAIIAEDIQMILEDLGYLVPKIIYRSEDAIDYLSFHNPDLVLCDINIKGAMDGIQVCDLIRRKKKLPFVYLTSLSDHETIQRASLTMPYGYIIKPFDESDLNSAIKVALVKFQNELNEMTISKSLLEEVAHQSVTDKESNIIFDMIKGLSYEDIQSKYDISKNTVKFHTKNIFLKFSVANRAELMQVLLLRYARVGKS